MNKKKTTGIMLSVLGVLSLVLITAGVTYAFFSYVKEGTTENTITTTTITFLYDELTSKEGNGIQITDALPMSDTDGKALTGTNNVFDFKITATSTGKASIPYEVTARMKNGSNEALADQVKLYLTTVNGDVETASPLTVNGDVVKTFGSLTQTGKVDTDIATEKTIYNGTVPAESSAYSQDFRLRMWVSGDEDSAIDYSPLEFKHNTDKTLITSTKYYSLSETEKANYTRIAYVNNTTKTAMTEAEYTAATEAERAGYEASEQLYLYSGQTFTVTVNVYANATVVTQ